MPTRLEPLALINVCPHKHTHAVPSTWGVDTDGKPPLCGSASLCHQPLSFSKLPVGKTHNFYTAEPGLAVAGIAVSLKCFLLGHLQAVLITRSLRGALRSVPAFVCLFFARTVCRKEYGGLFIQRKKGGRSLGDPLVAIFPAACSGHPPTRRSSVQRPALLLAGPCLNVGPSPRVCLGRSCIFILSLINYAFKLPVRDSMAVK